MQDCSDTVDALVNLVKKNIKSRDIMTLKAFENAMTCVMALGGSTNGILHSLALAHDAGTAAPSTKQYYFIYLSRHISSHGSVDRWF